MSSGSSTSSSASYPYLTAGGNVAGLTSSPGATYNPPVLTYTDLSAGSGIPPSTNHNNNHLLSAVSAASIVPTTAGIRKIPESFRPELKFIFF